MNKKMKQKTGKKCIAKRLCILGMAGTMAASLVGCGINTNASMNAKEETTQYEEKYMSNDETIKYEGNTLDLKFGANLSIKPSPKEIPEVKLTFYKPDEKVLVKELLQEGMRTEWYGKDEAGLYHKQYSGKNGDVLDIYEAGFTMFSDFYGYLFNSFHPSTIDGAYNAEKWSRTTDFKFMSRQEALDLVVKKLEKCGINLGDYEASFYCLDYKTLKKEEDVWDKSGNPAPKSEWKDKWTEDDNCYYISIRQKFNDIPEYHPMGGIDKRYEEANEAVQAVVSKDGIRYWNVDYVMQYENTGKFEKILSPQEILDKVIENKYYQYEYAEKPEYKLTKMNLCYFSDVDYAGYGEIFRTLPVYQLYIKEKEWTGDIWWNRVHQLIIDARTGEEVQTYDETPKSLNPVYH